MENYIELDLVGFDNVSHEQMMLEIEEKNKHKQKENDFYEEFEREQELGWKN